MQILDDPNSDANGGGGETVVKFCPIASGSSGNSLYIGTQNTKILIDAGLSGKKLIERLKELEVAAQSIDAIFITHEHTDHIKGAGILSRRFDIPVYATQGTWAAMEKDLGQIAAKNSKLVYEGENCVVNDICVMPFEIPHDAAHPVGYSVFAGKHKMTAATDLGHITDEVRENIAHSDVLLLEANHDVEMLLRGSYPAYLKKRILGDRGHISNETAGALLTEIIDERLKYIFLGHLSDENNEPHLAYETVEKILCKKEIKLGSYLKMDMAARYSNSCAVTL